MATLPETIAAAQLSPMTVVEDENGCYVKGLSCHLAQTEEDALNLLFEVSIIIALSGKYESDIAAQSEMVVIK